MINITQNIVISHIKMKLVIIQAYLAQSLGTIFKCVKNNNNNSNFKKILSNIFLLFMDIFMVTQNIVMSHVKACHKKLTLLLIAITTCVNVITIRTIITIHVII